MSLKGVRMMIGASVVCLLVGLYSPVMVLLDPGPSVMAYGIVLFSFPVWALGAVSGGLGGYLASRTEGARPRLRRVAWLLGALNLSAVATGFVWSPPGVS